MSQVYEQEVIPIVPSANDLRAMRVYPYPFAIPVLFLEGISSIGDGNQGFFQWLPTDTDSDDNLNTIASNWVVGQGRWSRLTSGNAIPGGAQNFKSRTTTSNTAFTATDSTLRADATSSALAITLPAVAVSGRICVVKKIDASSNAVTVFGDGLIDGQANFVIVFTNQSAPFQSNGTTWDIL